MDEERSLFPVVEVPDFAEEEDDYDRQYLPSPAWDMEKGDFVRDAANRVVMDDGLEAYRTWCVKAVDTERYDCASYDDDIGAEMKDAMKEKDQNAVELAIERTITETLLVNPRTESVEDFEFFWKGDSVKATFWVHAIEWEQFPLAIVIKNNRR